MAETFTFKAEIKQLLNILIHSLYTEREIFLRELVSNASDALNRIQFELLTNREVQDADAELSIEIMIDETAGTLTISDTGIGMTRDDLADNLGVIARSGAKAFIEAMQGGAAAQDVIGQFGVGFYSIFMVADKVRVISRSHLTGETAWAWESDGGETFNIEPAEREVRGTDIILHVKDDAKDFLHEWRIKEIIRKHSDYIAFPIYVGSEEEPTNKQTAIWRQDSKEVTDEQYNDFYKMLTLDFEGPIHRIHMKADVPLQFYALLFTPGSPERNILSPRKEPGLKLYARKVLIQDYAKDLLPEYLNFIQGVVDSEDIPLNVNRESIQANRIIANLKKTLTSKVLGEFKRLLKNKPEDYHVLFEKYGRFLKQGIAISPGDRDDLLPLLIFKSTRTEGEGDYVSLADYVDRMAENQEDIYYVIGDDMATASTSPHLDAFRRRGIEVLYFADPVDPFMVMGLDAYQDHKLRSVDEAEIDLSGIGTDSEEQPAGQAMAEGDFTALREHFASVLGERVLEVRESKNLSGSAARLVTSESGSQRNMFRINRLLDRDYELPVKILELNPRHPLLHNLSTMLASGELSPLLDLVVEQVFETALLQDGIHPNPAAMASRLQTIMEAATAPKA